MNQTQGWPTGGAEANEHVPEWGPFVEAYRSRRPTAGTACAAWTTFDVVAHNAGTLEEEAIALEAFVGDRPIPATRSFEEREAQYRAMSVPRLDAAIHAQLERFTIAAHAAEQRDADALLPWTGRKMKVRWFSEHIRQEFALHRWDLVGDDETSGEMLAQEWITVHSVDAVGAPLLQRGLGQISPGSAAWSARIRAADSDDLLVSFADSRAAVALVPPSGPATITTDASARLLLLWGRQPSDTTRWDSTAGPAEVGRLRMFLSGY